MAAPIARFRQTLAAPGLIQKLCDSFSLVQYNRREKSVCHSTPDTLMDAFAMINLKYPSMLCFDTKQFTLNKTSCQHCCVMNRSNGTAEFYHQILAAVMVHPELKTVLPIAFEPITKSDGDNKNDCERNAGKR